MSRAPGSFRDPAGHVFIASQRIFRGVSSDTAEGLRGFIQSDFFRERVGTLIVDTKEVSPGEALDAGIAAEIVGSYGMWVEHEPLPFISYPYEWSFEALKDAACLTLKLLVDGLENGFTLKDASAYNVQFIHSRPIFMDVLSFCEYREGDPFLGYKQFCEHFLAPLCLAAFSGVDFNQWFRGRIEGLDLMDVSTALPVSSCFRPQVLLHIHLQAWAMRKLESASGGPNRKETRKIPRRNLVALANGLREFITRLERKRTSYWQKYAEHNAYEDEARKDKTRIAHDFVRDNKLLRLLDLGCNTGEYCNAAVSAGAEQVIGVDFDCGAIDLAAREARRHAWPAWFLYYDIANPTPDMGWRHEERSALEKRLGRLDGVFCFALIHHLVIGRNIPMEEFTGWVCGLAQRGLIEFIPKTDPMVQGLLSHREDIFHNYNLENFERILNEICTNVVLHTIQSTDRTIYEYAR
ncbi:MAG: class I SAM-dependent methyltransferase [Gammaproteobacteria bacterium]|nr:class I SAM-dependent methyltransferase [Gammaproteobacteria bacterium]MDE0285964.1 class I SAM-dependent methyltransferase [Gammaproteobacteria bacterium]MDE0511825.1 class I SAM-dependent methyltransferase [Gammaproteobacteria bacterium]